MKIVELQAENVKTLRAVHIKPAADGSLVVIGGDNEAGKSSVLDSIEMALSGGRSIPEQPIRQGQSSARVVVSLDDYEVTRTFTGKGSRLAVKSKGGETMGSPQALLDRLTNTLSFDPLAFARMDGRGHTVTLKDLLKINFDDVDAQRKRIYDRRTDHNREAKRLAGELTGLQARADAPDEEVSVVELAEKQAAAIQAVEERQRAIDALEADEKQEQTQQDAMVSLKSTIESADLAIIEQQGKLANCEPPDPSAIAARIAILTEQHEDAMRQVNAREQAKFALELDIEDRERKGRNFKELNAQCEATKAAIKRQRETVCYDDPPDPTAIAIEIAAADTVNAQVRANRKRAELEAKIAEQETAANAATKHIEMIEADKTATLANADWPIEELAFDANGVTYKGVPFAQCSQGERIRVSTAIGLAMNSALRVLLIREGSLLDPANLAMIAEMAAAADAQVWIERVSKGDECTVIIEDGKVQD